MSKMIKAHNSLPVKDCVKTLNWYRIIYLIAEMHFNILVVKKENTDKIINRGDIFTFNAYRCFIGVLGATEIDFENIHNITFQNSEAIITLIA